MLRRLNDFEAAAQAFQAALKLSPKDPRLHSNLALVEGARTAFQNAMRADPKLLEPLPALTVMLLEVREHP